MLVAYLMVLITYLADLTLGKEPWFGRSSKGKEGASVLPRSRQIPLRRGRFSFGQ